MYKFCKFLRKTKQAIISPRSINWTVFLTEKKCADCALRFESSYKISGLSLM